ncbi:MAG: DUF423 domain-containing protein [Timaviella obliquedivisa GSE-PSE-MK23-08B]|nr:DUF423 domain-containing protein [Timaviella obliquedivisa GSE-PSE-MK23-08B]
MVKIFLAIAALLAGSSVALGAFASHGLEDKLTERALEIFETATRYQMYHALALGLVAVLLIQGELMQGVMAQPWLNAAGYAFIVGVIFFSGSLYALSFSGIKVLGAITPIGGVALMVGWGCLAIAAFSFK